MKGRRFRSFAKINLGLEVVAKLPSGYHELRTLFAAVSLHDVVSIAETKSGISIACDHPGVPDDETNLAHKAGVVMQGLSGRKTGVAIQIEKRIAVGGGLGGGSSNAATVLRALDLMWGLGLGRDGLLEAAQKLGADVPYFLTGGPALGLGRGDDIHPLNLRLTEKVLLVPGTSLVSTAAVFRRFAGGAKPLRSARSRIQDFLKSREGQRPKRPRPFATLRNDLSSAAQAEEPSLPLVARRVQRVGRKFGALQTGLSGSGSSFFLLFADGPALKAAALALSERGTFSARCSFLSRPSYERRFEIEH